jgi:hypothetical protein
MHQAYRAPQRDAQEELRATTSLSTADSAPQQLAWPAEQLAHPPVGGRPREAVEPLAGRVEADQRVGAEVAEPHHVAVVDVDRVGLRARSLT